MAQENKDCNSVRVLHAMLAHGIGKGYRLPVISFFFTDDQQLITD
jgi:hypothetical protein